MSDKSNWKNKNRNILKTAGEFLKKIGIDQEGTPHSSGKGRAAAAKRHFKRGIKKIVPGAIKSVKKITEPFIKEAIGLEGATKLLTGLKPKKKKKD